MIAALRESIAELLTTDATFLAALAPLQFGSESQEVAPTNHLYGWRDPRLVGQEHYPVWLFEAGDAQEIERAIGSCHQNMQVEVLVALLWHQQDPDQAVRQRDAVVDEVVRLFLREPRPGNVADTWLDAVANDRGANHPTHITTFRLLAELQITRD